MNFCCGCHARCAGFPANPPRKSEPRKQKRKRRGLRYSGRSGNETPAECIVAAVLGLRVEVEEAERSIGKQGRIERSKIRQLHIVDPRHWRAAPRL